MKRRARREEHQAIDVTTSHVIWPRFNVQGQPPPRRPIARYCTTMSSLSPPASSLAVDVAAAAKALDEVAAAGGAARLVMNRDGGASLVIQVTNDNKGKIERAQSAIKTLTSNSALKEANENEERDRLAREARREEMLTALMRAARDDKEGKGVQKEIRGAKAANGAAALEKFLNEVERECGEEEKEENSEKSSDITADEAVTDANSTTYGLNNSSLPREGGWAAIHFACDSGNQEGLRYLLEAGADPNLTERMGATPLHRVILGAGKYPLTQLRAGNAGKGNISSIMGSSSVDNGSKMALPGVVKSKTIDGSNNKVDDVPDNKYLDDYMKVSIAIDGCLPFRVLFTYDTAKLHLSYSLDSA